MRGVCGGGSFLMRCVWGVPEKVRPEKKGPLNPLNEMKIVTILSSLF